MQSWADIGVLAVMLVAGFVPFIILCRLMLGGKTGLALTVLALLGAALALTIYSVTVPLGLSPMTSILLGQLVLTPALIGACAGILLGWLIYRRRNPRQD
ncbi:UDP-N-acetylmuramate--alanine ligase [Yoonia sp. 208BN28-4]|uniref:UDP-N-acetylmuramate--alanine ligase n=1 Tax=Yoonia sp. 208BN28-4 TaxID=3126505 RepID=UPI00309E1B67